MATVRRLSGCLGNLPDRLRLVLQLRTGINVPGALSPPAVAKHLHISVVEVTRLEKRALRQLRQTARTSGCGAARDTASGLVAFGSFGSFGPPIGEVGGATGGVKGARYIKLPSRERPRLGTKPSSPGTASLLGLNIPPVASDATLLILIVLALVLLVSFVFADASGLGPRHEQWRRRWMRRFPWA
jgi:hypothetical protein